MSITDERIGQLAAEHLRLRFHNAVKPDIHGYVAFARALLAEATAPLATDAGVVLDCLVSAQANVCARRPEGSSDPESADYDHDAFMWDFYQRGIDAARALAAQPAAVEVPAQRDEQGEDTELLDWLEEQTKKSTTGTSFDYVKHVEDGYVTERGFRFMRKHFIGECASTLRAAIRAARAPEGGRTDTGEKA